MRARQGEGSLRIHGQDDKLAPSNCILVCVCHFCHALRKTCRHSGDEERVREPIAAPGRLARLFTAEVSVRARCWQCGAVPKLLPVYYASLWERKHSRHDLESSQPWPSCGRKEEPRRCVQPPVDQRRRPQGTAASRGKSVQSSHSDALTTQKSDPPSSHQVRALRLH